MGIAFGNKSLKMCLMNDRDCSKRIIRAHSIQNSFIIDKIQEENHVCMFDYKNKDLKKIGRKIAGVFKGFCSFHDNEIFKKIDFNKNTQINTLTNEQYTLFHFRAVANEYWLKLNSRNLFYNDDLLKNHVQKSGLNLKKDEMNKVLKSPYRKGVIKGNNLAIDDTSPFVESCKCQIKKKKYHLTKSFHFIFKKPCHFAVNSHTSPIVDFKDNIINKLNAPVGSVKFLAINLFPNNEKTHLILTWHKKFDIDIKNLVKQFNEMDLERKKIQISKFIIAHSENIIFNPSFINLKDQKWRDNFNKMFLETTNPHKLFFRLGDYPDISLF